MGGEDGKPEAERNEEPKRGRYVPAGEMSGMTEVFPLGPKQIEAAIRQKRRLAEMSESEDPGDSVDG